MPLFKLLSVCGSFQLYVIMAPLADQAIPCVYAFLERKTRETYVDLLEAVERRCIAIGSAPDPLVVVTDFESGAMSAVRQVFGDHVINQGCFYHLTQSTWRALQEQGLGLHYRENEDFRVFCGMLDGLAFLPVDEVKTGMQYLRSVMPAEAEPIVRYFDSTYVNGKPKEVRTAAGDVVIRYVNPQFPPKMWNIHGATINGSARTNNYAEGWNNRIKNLVGHDHPTPWTLIEALQADVAETEVKILRHNLGTLEAKKVSRSTAQTQKLLKSLCQQYSDKSRSMEVFLRALANVIRISCE